MGGGVVGFGAYRHRAILNPNIPFFRIMRKYLRGEIESKLDTLNKKTKRSSEVLVDIFK